MLVNTWDLVNLFDGVASASFNSVDNPIAFGDIINFSTTGLGTITSRTLSDGVNTINLTGTDITAILGGLADEVNRVLTGNVTFEVSDGTNTASTSIVLTPPAGQFSVKLEAGFDISNLSYLFNFGGAPAIGDEPFAPFPVDSLGGWEAPGPGTYLMHITDATDGFMESFNLIVTANASLSDATAIGSSVSLASDINTNSELLGGEASGLGVNSATPIAVQSRLSNADSVAAGVAGALPIGSTRQLGNAAAIGIGSSLATSINVSTKLANAESIATGVSVALPIVVKPFLIGGQAVAPGVSSAQDIKAHSILSNAFATGIGFTETYELVLLRPNVRLRSYSASRIFDSHSPSIN